MNIQPSKPSVLIIGPDVNRAKGGISEVIRGIASDPALCGNYSIQLYASYIDGSLPRRMLFSFSAFLCFLFRRKKSDIYDIHMASQTSVWRKGLYIRHIKHTGGKIVLHLHSGKMIPFYSRLTPKKQEKVRHIIRQADSVVVLSDRWKQYYEKTMGIQNCHVIQNGIDIEKYWSCLTDPAKTSCGFLSLARMCRTKGTYDLIEAVKLAVPECPDLQCYLAGDGEAENCSHVIAENHLEKNIHIVGWADEQKKRDLFKKVSTLVLPSYFEGQPVSILEGMAAGKVIISTKVGDIPAQVGEKNGMLITPGDIRALAQYMILCCRNPDIVSEISSANLKKAKDCYDIKKMHQQLGALFQKILS